MAVQVDRERRGFRGKAERGREIKKGRREMRVGGRLDAVKRIPTYAMVIIMVQYMQN